METNLSNIRVFRSVIEGYVHDRVKMIELLPPRHLSKANKLLVVLVVVRQSNGNIILFCSQYIYNCNAHSIFNEIFELLEEVILPESSVIYVKRIVRGCQMHIAILQAPECILRFKFSIKSV
jgi:hypothetical protein